MNQEEIITQVVKLNLKLKITSLWLEWCIHTCKRKAVTGRGANAAARQADRRNKEIVFKNCAPFIDCIIKINNT